MSKLGAYPAIPHTNTGAWFIGTHTPELWYELTLEFMRRCDAVILVPGWENSKGTREEKKEAERLGLPVFRHIDGLEAWLAGRCARGGCSHGLDSACRGGSEL